MKLIVLFLYSLLLTLQSRAQDFSGVEIAAWEKRASSITIIRDNWGIAHVYGKTDADAVFGLMYAQCEDDFAAVEMNYIKYLGRLAEVKGPTELYNDLLTRMVIDSADAINDFKKLTPYMKGILNAFADGVNYYMHRNAITPALLARFQPWYPLVWTHGSIGHINTAGISVDNIRDYYFGNQKAALQKMGFPEITSGSNAFAIAPSRSADKTSMLYINPHVTLQARCEAHMVSQEGLNVYGAFAWGQFFVYQGFNEKCGWAHTSSAADAADLYIEKLSGSGSGLTYLYDGKQRPVIKKEITMHFLADEEQRPVKVSALYTHHGPILTRTAEGWISLKASNRSAESLIQNWERGKVKNFAEFQKNMSYGAEANDNTTYADSEGNIAHWHGNFLPVRDSKFDWSKPVDGTITATEWKGMHKPHETVFIKNPSSGWIQNCNSSPFYGAGSSSPVKEAYPAYMAPDGENFRSMLASKLLQAEKSFTLDKLIAAGYNRTLPAFEMLIPALTKAYTDSEKSTTGKYSELAPVINLLAQWDKKVSLNSNATTIAIEWAERVRPQIIKIQLKDQPARYEKYLSVAQPSDLLDPLKETIDNLVERYGHYDVEWGDLNVYQRINESAGETFNDADQYHSMPWASATWGMLPSFDSRYVKNNTLRYGTHGNSFVCAVEFGPRLRAKALLAGGASGQAGSQHYNDQVEMYQQGNFRDVHIYKDDVQKNAERTYSPGE